MAGNDEKKRKVSAMLAVAAVGGSGGGKKSCKAGDGTDAAGEAPPRRSGRQRNQPPLVAEDEAKRAAAGKKSCSSEGEDYDDDDSIEDHDEEKSKGGRKRKGFRDTNGIVAVAPTAKGYKQRMINKHTEIDTTKGGIVIFVEEEKAKHRGWKKDNNPYINKVGRKNRTLNGKLLNEYLDLEDWSDLVELGEDKLSALIDPLSESAKQALAFALGIQVGSKSGIFDVGANLKKYILTGGKKGSSGDARKANHHFKDESNVSPMQAMFEAPHELSGKAWIEQFKIVVDETEKDAGVSNLELLRIAMGITSIRKMMEMLVKANFLIGPKNHPFLRSTKVNATKYERERLELIHPDITGPEYVPHENAASMRQFIV